MVPIVPAARISTFSTTARELVLRPAGAIREQLRELEHRLGPVEVGRVPQRVELRGQHFATIVARESRRLVLRTWRSMRETGEEQRIRFTMLRRDGTEMPVEIRATAIRERPRSRCS